MTKNRLLFFSPGMSKATLGDIFDFAATHNRGISGDTSTDKSQLNSDPLTVALIGAAGATVAALINAATQAFLEWKRKKNTSDINCSVKVTIYGTLGSSWTVEVNDKNHINTHAIQIPSDYSEIARIKLE